MLKLLRERAVENPIFLRCIMGGLAVTFIIGLGWWGTQQEEGMRHMAMVGEDAILLEEYNRAYQNTSRFYSQMLKTEFDRDKLRKQVLDQMVEQRLWLKEAIRIGLQVTDTELKEAILKLPGFQESGQFRPERYRRILEIEKMTPEQFEQQQRDELLIQKAKDMIRDSTALTRDELEELEKPNPPSTDPAGQADPVDQKRADRLSQKKEKAIRAYMMALKQRVSIVINDELL